MAVFMGGAVILLFLFVWFNPKMKDRRNEQQMARKYSLTTQLDSSRNSRSRNAYSSISSIVRAIEEVQKHGYSVRSEVKGDKYQVEIWHEGVHNHTVVVTKQTYFKYFGAAAYKTKVQEQKREQELKLAAQKAKNQERQRRIKAYQQEEELRRIAKARVDSKYSRK